MTIDRFAERRAALLEQLGETVAIIAAGHEQTRNDDVMHSFRQDSDFHFLTGFTEPDAVALLDSVAAEPYTLFVRPRDPEREAWTGHRSGVAGAVSRYGADAAFPLDELAEQLRRRLAGRRSLAYAVGGGLDDDVHRALRSIRSYASRSGAGVPGQILDIRPLIAELRVIKSAPEIEALREACRISAIAHEEAMRFAGPGRTEGQVQAALEYVFGVMGSERVGYGTIVAGGDNACILHYVENDQSLVDGDLLLVDAGAEYRHLTADITRTFPVNGRFTTPQRAIYELVLQAEQAVIAECRPGLAWTRMHERSIEVLAQGMVDLGLLPGSADEVMAKGWYRQFFFHGTGHWLGIDVHDAGRSRFGTAGRPLEPGMAFTVEPGVYIARDKGSITLSHAEYDPDERLRLSFELGAAAAKAEIERRKAKAGTFEHAVPAEYLGLGVRIEDDLLITPEGHENLSVGSPVKPDEVEARCAETSSLALFE